MSVDEKTQIQALDRTQKRLPTMQNYCATRTCDYKRNGTISLFTALNVATGKVAARLEAKHTSRERLLFLKQIDREVDKSKEIHIILDNCATRKTKAGRKRLRSHPRFSFHFTPTSSSWLNVVERWFADLTNKTIRRDSFKSVTELKKAIWEYIDEYNKDPRARRWTKTAEKILAKVDRARKVYDKLHTE